MYNLTMYDLTTNDDMIYYTGVDLATAVLFSLLFNTERNHLAHSNLSSLLRLLEFDTEHCIEYHDMNIGIKIIRTSANISDIPHHRYQD